MKKFRLLLCVALLSFAMPKTLLAWNLGDTLHVANSSGGTIIYQVTGIINRTLRVVGTKNVTTLNLPSNGKVNREDVEFTITEIGGFYGIEMGFDFSGLQSVGTIPNTVTHISQYAFMNSSITTITLPESVKHINLESCYQLQTINLGLAGSPYFDTKDGVLYTKNFKTLICCPPKKTFPNGAFTMQDADTIGRLAFYNVANLKSLTIPASVKHFEYGEIYSPTMGCSNLTEIKVPNNPYFCNINNDGVVYTKDQKTLVLYPAGKNAGGSFVVPASVTKIDTAAFNSARIQSLNLSNVQRIEFVAFYGSNIGNLTIPASLKYVSGIALNTSGAMTSISVAAGNTNYKIVNNALYTYDGKTLVKYPRANAATSYNIQSGTEVIDDGAFWNCYNIITLNIPASVTQIGMKSFRSLSNCTSIKFASGSKLKNIGHTCFWGCNALTTITLPASVETIEELAFSPCTSLKTVTIETPSQLKSIGRQAFYRCPELTTFEFRDNGSSTLDSIGHRAFADTKLKSFDIPASLRYIGESAFNNCRQLATVGFPEDNVSILDTIANGAFANTAFTLTRIPSSVRCIGREAFWNVKTSPSLAISSRTDSISPEAFKGCYTLKNLNVDRANQKYSSSDGMLLTKDKETLVLFPSGKANDSFNLLAPSLRRIGDYAFYDNDRLKSVVIPNKVTSLGKRALGLCRNLGSVTFLCDEMIDPANIEQLLNESTFDDGVTTDADRRKNIDIYVRKAKLGDYNATGFYQKFKSITPSFDAGDSEYIPVSEGAVDLLSTTSTDHTFVVPKSVSNGGNAYAVKLIGDYAFQNAAADIKEVVVPGEIDYIGAKAFMNDITNNGSDIKSVFLISGNVEAQTFSTTRFELDDTGNDYSEFAASTKVYVKKRVFNSAAFGNAVARYTSDATTYLGTPVRPATPNMFDYKIPGINLTKTYGTFAREFDVDLADYFAEYGAGKVYAFTSAPDQTIYEGRGDGSEPGTWYIRMYSINENQNGDGIYIPAYTGVLLKSMGGAATPTESAANGAFYYTIGDSTTVNTSVSSVLVGVTVRNREVKDTNKDIYVMSGGVFKPLNGQTVASFPVHKAYLQLPSSQYPGSNTSGAKLVFLFDGVPTEIDAFGMDGGLKTKDGGPVYDLQGRRVNAPQKGIYVRNGKKIVIK